MALPNAWRGSRAEPRPDVGPAIVRRPAAGRVWSDRARHHLATLGWACFSLAVVAVAAALGVL